MSEKSFLFAIRLTCEPAIGRARALLQEENAA